MLLAYFVFFSKFGTVIFFIIIQSLVFSIFFYSAVSAVQCLVDCHPGVGDKDSVATSELNAAFGVL